MDELSNLLFDILLLDIYNLKNKTNSNTGFWGFGVLGFWGG
jgi:hypothetical protein